MLGLSSCLVTTFNYGAFHILLAKSVEHYFNASKIHKYVLLSFLNFKQWANKDSGDW